MKKYKVSFEISIFMIVLFIFSTGTFILSLFLGLYEEDIILVLMTSLMLFILPLILFIIIIYTMWPTIIIDNEGIKKYLFGKLRRCILWEEVKSIKLLGNYKQWLFISKSKITTKSLTLARIKKDNIYIYYKKNILEDFRTYIPEKIDYL